MINGNLWDSCLHFIKTKIPEQAYQTWFDGISATQPCKNEIMLQVPNQFHYEWLDSKYSKLIKSAVIECSGVELKINYSVVISDQEENIIPDLIQQNKGGSLIFKGSYCFGIFENCLK